MQHHIIEPIVLVEDDPNDVFFVRRAMTHARIRNPLLTFGTTALARQEIGRSAAGQGGVVLFIVDLHLPGGESGLDFLRWLRQQGEPLGTTPTIVLTGSQQRDDRDLSAALGAMRYLQKPVTEQTLTDAAQALGFVILTSGLGSVGARIIQRR